MKVNFSQTFCSPHSAVVRSKRDRRGVWRTDAEVSHTQRLDGCCKYLKAILKGVFAVERLFTYSYPSQISEKYGVPTEGIAKVYKKSKKGWVQRRSSPWLLSICCTFHINNQSPSLSESWWTWMTTSSSTTPTRTPSFSTLTATQTPTRSRSQRSELSTECWDGKKIRKLWQFVGQKLQGCYWLADKLDWQYWRQSVGAWALRSICSFFVTMKQIDFLMREAEWC